MKFSLAPLALLALAGVALAQESSQSTSSTSAGAVTSSSSSSSVSSSSSSSSAASSSPAPSSAAGGSSSGSNCALLPGYDQGNPLATQYGCTQNASTSTPVYDSTKLQSYLIGGYTRQKEGEHIESVAADLAKSVVDLYPTLTVPLSDIREQYETAISASIDAVRSGQQTLDPNGGFQAVQFNSMLSMAAAGVAVLAGGAFML